MSPVRSFETDRWTVAFYHQWDSFLPKVNWRDFTFICIEGEWNYSWPRAEVRVVLLGLGIHVVRERAVKDVKDDDEDWGHTDGSEPVSSLPGETL